MPRILIIQKEHVQIKYHVQKESCSEKYAENTVNSKLQNSILNLEVFIKNFWSYATILNKCVWTKLQPIYGFSSSTRTPCVSRPTLGAHKNSVCRSCGTENRGYPRAFKGKEVCQELDLHLQTSPIFPSNDTRFGNRLSSNRDNYLVCPSGDLDNLCPSWRSSQMQGSRK